jgi:hypothetical protein
MPDAFVEVIDISSNQRQVDWSAVAKTEKAFTFARATIGGHQADAHFSDNWTAILSAVPLPKTPSGKHQKLSVLHARHVSEQTFERRASCHKN